MAYLIAILMFSVVAAADLTSQVRYINADPESKHSLVSIEAALTVNGAFWAFEGLLYLPSAYFRCFKRTKLHSLTSSTTTEKDRRQSTTADAGVSWVRTYMPLLGSLGVLREPTISTIFYAILY